MTKLSVSVLSPLLLLVFSSLVWAETAAGWPTLSLFAGGYSFDADVDLDTRPAYGLRLGYDIKGQTMRDRLGIEAVFLQVHGTAEKSRNDVRVSVMRLDALYQFDAWEKFNNMVPFFAVGGGGRFVDDGDDSDSSPLAAYGAGLKIPFNPSVAVRIDLRHVLVFADQQQDELSCSLGFQYTFGQSARAAAVAVLDSDGDGVADERDQCAQTPSGMTVNGQGCPVDPPDGDRDGVPDYLDRCRNTVRGAVVDASGCLSDRDNDGVADVFDKCPDNPPGFEVGADGCMKISR